MWILEDIGGATSRQHGAQSRTASSYRYVPDEPGDLERQAPGAAGPGRRRSQPITQTTQTAVALGPTKLRSHVRQVLQDELGRRSTTPHRRHAPFDANTLAKAADGTPFKRPENGHFRPATQVQRVLLRRDRRHERDEPRERERGGWCSVSSFTRRPGASTGTLSIFYKGDGSTRASTTLTFLSHDQFTFVEDAGDTLHGQRNALDSGWIFDVTRTIRSRRTSPFAGWPRAATLRRRSTRAAGGSGKNDGDNEITGMDVSDGDPNDERAPRSKEPAPRSRTKDWRSFYTQQHGDNRTYEVVFFFPELRNFAKPLAPGKGLDHSAGPLFFTLTLF